MAGAGEDVTEQVKHVKDIPQTLKTKTTCSIRGELICKQKDFELVQKELAEAKAHKFDPEWLNADLEVAFLRAYSQLPAPAAATRAGSTSAVGATGRRPQLSP